MHVWAWPQRSRNNIWLPIAVSRGHLFKELKNVTSHRQRKAAREIQIRHNVTGQRKKGRKGKTAGGRGGVVLPVGGRGFAELFEGTTNMVHAYTHFLGTTTQGEDNTGWPSRVYHPTRVEVVRDVYLENTPKLLVSKRRPHVAREKTTPVVREKLMHQ